jgi:GH25 family lysozyme M1 (1,4-beta-N-acetylmuramidase)
MTRTLGVDISEWSGKVDFGKMKSAGVEFCYTKACQLLKDAQFSNYWPAMKQAGLLRGAFAYLDWRDSELKQAKLFTDTLGGDVGELPPMLDLEMDPTPYKLSPALVQGKVWNWIQAVEKTTGRVPIIYCGAYFWTQWMTSDPGWLKYPFWLAWYSSEAYINFISLLKGWHHGAPKPWPDWLVWQDAANASGYQYGTQALSIDRDWFNGDLAALKAWASGAPVPGPAPIPTPAPIPAPVIPASALGAYRVVKTSWIFPTPNDATPGKLVGQTTSNEQVTVSAIMGDWAQLSAPVAGWVRLVNLKKV